MKIYQQSELEKEAIKKQAKVLNKKQLKKLLVLTWMNIGSVL